jgi:signal transduction histidine kinase/ligand-binding sensor domain-containing protein
MTLAAHPAARRSAYLTRSNVVRFRKLCSNFPVVPPLPRLFRIACILGVSSLALFSTRAAGASPWAVRVWASDGLTDRTIVGAALASDGFLWVATSRRLARFDGVHFEEFQLGELAPVGEVRIRAFAASRHGGLWVAIDQGQIIYLGPDGTRVFTDNIPTAMAEMLIEDDAGNAWISFQRGAVCRITPAGQITTFGREAGLVEAKCFLSLGADGRIWFMQNGLIGVFRHERFEKLNVRGTSASGRLVAAKSGGAWVASTNGLFRYKEGEPLQRVGGASPAPFAGYPSVLLEDRAGALWIGTVLDGLYRYTEGGKLERIPTSYPEITSLSEDREGNIWVGTVSGGLNRVTPRAISIEGDATGLPHEAVQSICEDAAGVFWAATQNGALVTRTLNGPWQTGPAHWPTGATCVTPDPRGGVWVGTRKRTLHRVHDGNVETWGPDDGLTSHTVGVVVPARDGTVWFGCEGPPAVLFLRDGKLHTLALPPGVTRVLAMTEDTEGRIWVGLGSGGLLRVENDQLVDATPAARPNAAVRALHAAPDGTLWLGYKGGGIGRLRGGQFTHIRSEHGLFSDAVSHFVPEVGGWLWCGGDDGVFKVRLQALTDFAEGRSRRVQSIHYGAGQGLPTLQVTAKAWGTALRSRDGRIWIPMGPALFVADPARAKEDLAPPPVLVTHVKADGRLAARHLGLLPSSPSHPSRPVARLPATEPLRLAPIRQKIDFAFTALSFTAPENAHFRYRLENFDDDWVEAGTQRLASYTHVPAGRYRFHVQTSNSEGVWHDAGASLALLVAPFYWQMGWFRLLAVTGFTAATAFIVRRISHRRLQNKILVLQQQMALEKERARIARDLHDDAGNRLTRVMLLSKLAWRERAEPEKSGRHLEQLSAAARDASDALDEIVWSVNPHNDTLPDLIAYLVRFATELCDAAGIACVLEVPPQLPNREVPTDVRHNLFLAAKEAINNAVRHAQATELRLGVNTTAEGVAIIVADNGRGLLPAPSAPGADGLRNLRQRMEEVGGRFEIVSSPGGGTRLTFFYPWPHSR